MTETGPKHDRIGPGRFATTRWSLVLAAGQAVAPDAQQALATLCQTYWYPLYAFARGQGHRAEDAQDLTQEFFTRLLEKGSLRDADPQRGKFRSFLLASFKHFLAKEWDRANTQKRGGGRQHLSLNLASGETCYLAEPAHELTPERIYERRWALTLIDQVIGQLRPDYACSEKLELFDKLKIFLTGEKGPAYSRLAGELGLTEGALKVAVHRLRHRFRDLLRAEIAHTVAGPEEVEEELQDLFAAVSSTISKPL